MRQKPEEGYWKAAAMLASAVRTRRYGSVVFSAPAGREGTTTVALQVAHALSIRCDVRPLVVELDFWRPAMVKRLKLDPNRTLDRVLAGELSLSNAVQRLDSGVGILAASAKRRPPVKQLTPLVADAVALADSRWDMVLVDAPPLTEHGAVLNIGSVIPRLLMVVRAGRSSSTAVERYQRDLHNVGMEVFGAILNREKRYVPGWIERSFLS